MFVPPLIGVHPAYCTILSNVARCLVPLLCVEVGWFPARFYEKIEPYLNKDFEIDDFTAKETLKKEIINITLTRDKPAEQIRDPKPA
jgi:hypothetical protein